MRRLVHEDESRDSGGGEEHLDARRLHGSGAEVISLGCDQPLHVCPCLSCDDERRANIRDMATRLMAKYAYVQRTADDEDSGEVYCGASPTVRPGRSK